MVSSIPISDWLGLPHFWDLFAYLPNDILLALSGFLTVLFALALWRVFKG